MAKDRAKFTPAEFGSIPAPGPADDVTPADDAGADVAPPEANPTRPTPAAAGGLITESPDPAPGTSGVGPVADAGVLAAMRAQIDRLTAALGAGVPAAAPPGFKLVPDDGDEARRKDLARLQADLERSVEARSQDEANRRYPEGKFVYRCSLPDKNGHPTLTIRAGDALSARAYYLDVIGVNSTDSQVLVEKQ
jgi:hypothetical protein